MSVLSRTSCTSLLAVQCAGADENREINVQAVSTLVKEPVLPREREETGQHISQTLVAFTSTDTRNKKKRLQRQVRTRDREIAKNGEKKKDEAASHRNMCSRRPGQCYKDLSVDRGR